MFDRPILFYSDYCIHSKNFLNALMKHQELFDSFIRINIDVDVSTKQRPNVFYNIQRELGIQIKEIPTIITPGPEHVLTGADAFEWLDFQTKSLSKESIEGFNCIEMGSFSDSYSTYGSSDLNDAKQQTFKFIGKNDDRIETPPETASSISKDEYSRKQQERETFDNVHYNTKQNTKQSAGGSFNPSQNSGGSFNPKQNGGGGFNPSQNGGGGVSDKQKDFDYRLQQMMMERENFGNVSQKH
jgi:hypothetical protein